MILMGLMKNSLKWGAFYKSKFVHAKGFLNHKIKVICHSDERERAWYSSLETIFQYFTMQ